MDLNLRAMQLQVTAHRGRGYYLETGHRGVILAKHVGPTGLEDLGGATLGVFGYAYAPLANIPATDDHVRHLVAGYEPLTQAVVIIEYGPGDREGPDIVGIAEDFDAKTSIQ